MSNLLGIDVGTTGTRAIVIDAGGRIIGSATHEHVPFASAQTGWAEQDPRDWWQATCGAVRAALAAAQRRRQTSRRSASRDRCTAPCCSTTAAR